MSLTLTIEVPVTFPHPGRGGHQQRPAGEASASLPVGRVPRVARLMALALRWDELVRTGQVANYSALAAFSSGQLMAWPVSASTLAAVSTALSFADLSGWFDGSVGWRGGSAGVISAAVDIGVTIGDRSGFGGAVASRATIAT